MRGRLMAVAVTAALTLAACGGDDDTTSDDDTPAGEDAPSGDDDAPQGQDEIADRLIAEMNEASADSEGAMTVDEACVRETAGDLSDEDAEILSQAWNDDDVMSRISPEGAIVAANLIDCVDIDLSGISIPDISMPDITVPSP